MEFFINDPNIERLPPTSTRLLDLRAEASPDGKHLRVALDLTPFQQGPYIELSLTDSAGNEIASASIVEPVGWKLELTLHIRRPALSKIEGSSANTGKYTLATCLSYPDLGEVDHRSLTIEILTPAQ
jgi:hypothetical protein